LLSTNWTSRVPELAEFAATEAVDVNSAKTVGAVMAKAQHDAKAKLVTVAKGFECCTFPPDRWWAMYRGLDSRLA